MERVSTGQRWKPPRAADQNAIIEATEYYQQQIRLGQGGGGVPDIFPSDLIRLKNSSGGDIVAGRVLEVGASLLTTLDRHHLWLDGVTPTPDGLDSIAIALRPMPSTAIDWCQTSGNCLARVNVNHVQHKYADVDASSTLLQSKWHGRCEILKPPGSTGEQDLVVRIGEMFRGPINIVATSGITAGSSASCAVWWAGAAASPASTITVHLNWMDGGNNITAGAEAQCFWHPDQQKYVVSNTEC